MASWSLFNELEGLRREMDEALKGFGVARPVSTTFLSPGSARRFPLLNLTEDQGQLYLEALVPGVDPSQLELSLLRNTITISGQRKSPVQNPGEVVHRSELGFGKFSRTLDLPTEIDPERTTAEFSNGVLRISMAQAEHAKPKKIEVQIS